MMDHTEQGNVSQQVPPNPMQMAGVWAIITVRQAPAGSHTWWLSRAPAGRQGRAGTATSPRAVDG